MRLAQTSQRRWLLLAIVLTAVLLGLSACGGGDGSSTESDTAVVTLPADDPAMGDARTQAQKQWPEFVESFDAKEDGLIHDVRMAFPIAAGGTESVWVAVTSIDGTVIEGTLSQDPVNDIGVVDGDKVSLELDQVDDWAVFRKGDVVLGGFSIEPSESTETGSG